MKVSQNLIEFKKHIEKSARKSILIVDAKQHKDWMVKPRAFVENEKIYIDSNLNEHDYEESLFHELTHIYFRYQDYPRVLPTQVSLSPNQQYVLDKILSLAEDLFVDKFLAKNNYIFEKYNYLKELKKIIDINKLGKYINVGGQNLSDEQRLIVTELMFIRLIIDENYNKNDKEIIKKICIKNLGDNEWLFIKNISNVIKNINNRLDTNQNKLFKMFKFLINKYELKEVALVKFI